MSIHMKKISLFGLGLFLAGCVSVSNIEEVSNPRAPMTKIKQVRVGMTAPEVAGLMGQELRIGYQVKEQDSGSYEALIIKNPSRSEVINAASGKYTVEYYFTQVNKADNIIAEDELTPLVFQDGKLIAKGWDPLFKLKNN